MVKAGLTAGKCPAPPWWDARRRNFRPGGGANLAVIHQFRYLNEVVAAIRAVGFELCSLWGSDDTGFVARFQREDAFFEGRGNTEADAVLAAAEKTLQSL